MVLSPLEERTCVVSFGIKIIMFGNLEPEQKKFNQNTTITRPPYPQLVLSISFFRIITITLSFWVKKISYSNFNMTNYYGPKKVKL